jgi:hypothetical protein
MKEKFIAGLTALVLAAAPRVMAQPSDIWENNGTVTTVPIIDALSVVNDSGGVINITTTGLFDMSDALNFTNNGQMQLSPGLDFRTKAANLGLPKPAANFVNNGNGPSGGVINISGSPAKLLVAATNIENSGTITISATSIVNLDGEDIDFSQGLLDNGAEIGGRNTPLDGFWAVGAQTNQFIPAINFGTANPFTPPFQVTTRNYQTVFDQLAFTGSSNYVYDSGIVNSNEIIDAVFVQNSDPRFNISVFFDTSGGVVNTNLPLAPGNLRVQWQWNITNRITGQVTTNNFLDLTDDFGETTNIALVQNGTAGPNPTFKPTNYVFTLTSFPFTRVPPAVPVGVATNFPFSGETNQFAAYEIEFGAGPALVTDVAGGNATNTPGRIEMIAANTLNLSNAIVASVNYLNLAASNHFKGNQGAYIAAPTTDMHLRITNGLFSVTNLVAPDVNQLSGNVDLWSARFTNMINVVVGTGTNATTNSITNSFHVLFVNSQLSPTTVPVVQTLDLTSTNTALAGAPGDLVISDVLNVTSDLSLKAKSLTLTLNSTNSLTPEGEINIQNQNIIWPTSAPQLLYFTNFGLFSAGNAVFFGGSHSNPAFDNSLVNIPYLALVNDGIIEDSGSLIWANYLENTDGIFFQGSGGSFRLQQNIYAIIKDSIFNFSTIYAPSGSISFESSYLMVSNATFTADGTIDLRATNILTDTFVNLASLPTSQQQAHRLFGQAIGNTWTCSDLTLRNTPAIGGDLLTTIVTCTSPSNQVDYVTWAGQDRGPDSTANPSGFFNNSVLGVLDLTNQDQGSKFIFQGPDNTNRYAIYIDQLVLGGSLTNYMTDTNSTALQIRPNMKVYFGGASLESGASISKALNGRAGGGFIWVSNYNYGYFSSIVSGGRLVNADNPGNTVTWTPPAGTTNVPTFPNQPFFVTSPLSLAPAVVGDTYSSTIAFLASGPLTNSGLSFGKVSGPGWLNVAANGLLSGTPTITDAGTNEFVFNVTAAGSLSASATGFIIVSTNDVEAGSSNSPAILTGAPALSTDTSSTAAGSYYGLVSDTNNGVSVPSSGYVTMNVTARGNYTAKILLAGRSFSFSGSLANGSSAGSLSANNGSLLKLQLQQSGPNQIHGSVSSLTGHWSAALLADRLVFNKAKNPAPSASYTMVIPPDPASPSGPGGYGSGTVKVDAGGHVQWVGTLADGSKVSQGSALSKDGYWPLFNSLYGGQGLLIGWMQFTNQAVNGTVDWLKPKGTFLKAFSSNFTNSVTATGVIYKNPAHGSALNLTSGTLNLSLGNNTVVYPFTLDAHNRVHSTSKNLKLNIKPDSGLMSGSVVDPVLGRTSFQGVLLQSTTNGFGFFLQSDQSGQVNLAPAQ